MEHSRLGTSTEPARRLRDRLVRALDTLAWIAGAGVLVLLVTTACATGRSSESEVTGTIEAGTQQEHDSDPEEINLEVEEGQAEATLDAAFGSPHLAGPVWSAHLEITGDDTAATATLEKAVCLTAEAFFISTFNSMNFQFEKACAPGDDGTIDVAIDWDVSVNGVPLEEKTYEWVTAGTCADEAFTTTGEPPVQTNIPNFRFFAARTQFRPDDIAVQPGDEIRIDSLSMVRLILGTGGPGSRLEVTGSYRHDVTGGTVHPCDQQCTTDAGCSGGQLCEHGNCVPFAFRGKVAAVQLATAPDLDATFAIADDTAQIQSITITGPQDALALNPVAIANQGVGIFTVAALQELLQASGDPNVYFADLDNDTALDPQDVTVEFSEDAQGFVIDVTIPNGGDGTATIRTYPAGQVRLQLLPDFVDIAQTGTYPITVTVTTVDPTSPDGTNDGVGQAPLEETFVFQLSNGVLNPPAGDRDGDGTPDDEDGCPDDPFKTSPGVCNCGTPDTDSDGDNTSDCFDECFADPTKVDPGSCGCGVPDVNTDGDGALDCFEACDTDPAKTEPGLCGCGLADDSHGQPCNAQIGGPCWPGQWKCAGGNRFCESATTPQQETCNGIDDDCDTQVDDDVALEGTTCDTDLHGPCREGRRRCANGALGCEALHDPEAEVCNGIDDDCDGPIDEGVCQDVEIDSLGGSVALNAKPGKDKLQLKGKFPWNGVLLDPDGDGLVVNFQHASFNGTATAMSSGPAWTEKTSKKGDLTITFKDAKDGALGAPGSKEAVKVACKVKTDVCTFGITVQQLDLPDLQPGETTVSLTTGGLRFFGVRIWDAKSKGKKLVPRDE